MKAFLPVLAALVLAFTGCTADGPAANSNTAVNTSAQPPAAAGVRTPVLVELFTSEGCGNCPPADQNLVFMENEQPVPEADLITLGFHVDYFNDRGWEDPYSSADYTRRQSMYANRMRLESFYTPQMVVDGRFQFIGSDGGKAEAAIQEAARTAKGMMTLKAEGAKLEIDIRDVPQHAGSTIFLAIAEDGLVSEPKAGSNRGKKLPHISVVRKFGLAGKLTPDQRTFRAVVNIPQEPQWKKENIKYVAFVQDDATGKILVVGRAKAAA